MNSYVKRIVAAAMVGVLSLCLVPAPIIAAESSSDLQTKLDEANAHLEELDQQLMDANETLNQTKYELEQKQAELDQTNAQIDQTKADIAAKQAELDQARSELSGRVSSEYKTGGVNFLEIIFESTSFEDFVSRVYYADKISAAQNDAITQVENLKTELESQQATLEEQQQKQQQLVDEQQQLVTQQQEQTDALQAQTEEQQAYVDSLDTQVQEALQREEEERQAAAQAAAEAAAAAAAQNNGNYYSGSGSTTVSGSTGSLSDSQRNTIIAAAYSALGTPYVYGGTTPNVGIDCSGLAQYAYGCAGISLPHYSQSMLSMCTPLQSPSSLQPGDLVFWTSPKHVAIYLGNNQIIEAVPGGVRVTTIWGNCVGGGCPV